MAASARPIRSIFDGLAGALELELLLRRLGADDGGLLLAFGAQDRRLPLGFGRLDDGRLQLLLAARRFLLLDEHFLLLAHLVDARFLLGDALPRDGGGERPGLLRLRLLGLDRGVELGLPRFLVAQRLRDGDVGLVALGLAFLVGHRRLDHRVALRLRLADDGVALDLGRALLAERVEVALLVADLLDGQDVDVDAHLLQIDGGFVGHLLREGLAVGVDLFDRERAEDRAQVAFERLEDDALDLLGGHAEEPLRRAAQRHVVAGDLDVGDRLDRDRHAFLRVGALDPQRNRDDVEREVRDLLEHRHAQRRAAAHDAEADRRLVALLVDDAVLAAVEDRDRRRAAP